LVPLRAGEFELLLAFVERPQRVLSRDQLLDLSRGRSASVFDRSIDVQVSRLRRKIEPDPKEPTLIKTVRSGGYILAANVIAIGAS
jgi:two-component system OmpR family response regulator